MVSWWLIGDMPPFNVIGERMTSACSSWAATTCRALRRACRRRGRSIASVVTVTVAGVVVGRIGIGTTGLCGGRIGHVALPCGALCANELQDFRDHMLFAEQAFAGAAKLATQQRLESFIGMLNGMRQRRQTGPGLSQLMLAMIELPT